jgi:hypothetical protein
MDYPSDKLFNLYEVWTGDFGQIIELKIEPHFNVSYIETQLSTIQQRWLPMIWHHSI